MNQLKITQSAANKIMQVSNEEDKFFHISVMGGGCSGFQYCFEINNVKFEDDILIDEKSGVEVLVDPISYPYIANGKLDFLENLMGSKFIIDNPNAMSQCGCGSSFAI